jgi:hypothetical protein
VFITGWWNDGVKNMPEAGASWPPYRRTTEHEWGRRMFHVIPIRTSLRRAGWVLLTFSLLAPAPCNPFQVHADSRTRFSHRATLTPLINSHRANTTSTQPVNITAFTWRSGTRNAAKLFIR